MFAEMSDKRQSADIPDEVELDIHVESDEFQEDMAPQLHARGPGGSEIHVVVPSSAEVRQLQTAVERDSAGPLRYQESLQFHYSGTAPGNRNIRGSFSGDARNHLVER